MDCSAEAARVVADGDSQVARPCEDGDRGCRVRADDVVRASGAEGDVRTITCSGAGFSGAGAGKGEHGSGHFLSKQSAVESGSCREGIEEVMEAKQDQGRSGVSLLNGPSSEALETSDARDSWMHGFEVGDMVWGKVKSHPWWPGHIFNEAFASSSVRRTKREGHVLVAFFGDSSYGWFDPAELIPFDLHYGEKSRQTSSRNFTKAVEEAVDEASRRSALGLSCCCRSFSNFRSTTVPGYFVVDVAGYEPGGVYSSKQIKKARDDFATVEMLSFVNQLAVMPHDSEQGSIDLIKKTATLLALRKAMFEEFDVTYAEAFGVQPVLPSRAIQGGSEQHEKVPFRAAPLSGPLVIAETLRGRKGSSKAVVRTKDASAKKNRYLFKRREEPASAASSLKSPPPSSAGGKQRPPSPSSQQPGLQLPQPNVHYVPHGQADVVVAAADGNYEAEVGNYVLQKRVPPPSKQELGRPRVPEFSGFSPESLDRAAEPGEAKPEQSAGDELSLPIHEGGAAVKVVSRDGNKSSLHEYKPVVDAKEGLKTPPGVFADADVKLSLPEPDAIQGKEVEQAVGSTGVAADGAPSPMDVDTEHHPRTSQAKPVDGAAKKEKARKHPPGVLDGVKKKKRKRKEGGLENSADHPTLRQKKDEGSPRLSAGKSIGVGLACTDSSLAEAETKADGEHNSFIPPDSAALPQLPKLDLASHSFDLPAILGDLSALALDPFYGAEQNVPAVVRHVLLRFRSLVYEKALRSPPAGEHETAEPHAVKLRAARPPQEAGKENAGVAKEGEPTKPPKMKPILKAEEPTKEGRKRMPSDRQEEKLAKKLKKLDRLKALTSERKAGLVNKASDAQPRGEPKDAAAGSTVVAPAKFPKADPVKKQEAPAAPKVPIPTYLVMKFPQRSSLPTNSSLKARFARFGPLDLTGTKVFWKTFTCRVLFKHKSDAQSAYNYAQSNDIFGQLKVLYFLREYELQEADATDPAKRPATGAEDTPQFRPAGSGDLASDSKPKHQSLYSGQLKSILKKPSGEEAAAPAGGSGGVVKEAPRVKFMLGGDNGRGVPPVVVSSSNNNNGGNNAAGILPTPPLMDINRKPTKSVSFFQPLQPPLRPQDAHAVPLPSTPAPRAAPPDMPGPSGGSLFGRAPPHQARYGESEARERSGVDISHQMLSLLARCSDIVTNVKSALGYVPYHAL